MIVLDTNVISELMKPLPDPRVQAWLQAQREETLSTTAVTVAEIEYGLQRLPMGQRKARLCQQFDIFIEAIAVLPLDATAAREAGRLRALREAAGLPSQPSDMLIAGTVQAMGARLATRNTGDFSALPLEVLNPWES